LETAHFLGYKIFDPCFRLGRAYIPIYLTMSEKSVGVIKLSNYRSNSTGKG